MNRIFITFVISILLLAGQSYAAEKTVSLASVPWPPYYGQYLPNYGIGPEVVTASFESMGYRVEYHFMAWARALKEVKEGKYDGACNAYYTDERAKIYMLSEPYMESSIVFFRRKGSSYSWNNLEDLKPYRIGVVKGYANSPEFDAANFLKKKVSSREILNVKKLLLKQCELVVMDKFTGFYINDVKLFGHERNVIEAIDPPLMVNRMYVAFSRVVPGTSVKLDIFNRGLDKIKQNGKLDEILKSHGM